jgi:hypothetical protein
MNDEIILSTLKEIRDDQKLIVEKVTRLDREMEISRNGYSPHQILEMYHWIDNQIELEKKRSETIRKSIIACVTPILLTALVIGIMQLYK